MRILVYGGCHAGVIKEILLRFCDEVTRCDLITNYLLIASGVPFPVEKLSEYDAVIFSPIFNKDSYNTSDLPDLCVQAGALPVCYPWLQWNGYHPEALKYPGVDWLYRFWIQAQAQRVENESEAQAQEGWPRELSDYNFAANLSTTTGYLLEQEHKSNSNIRMANFIMENYRKSSLFLTPDHPSDIIYKELIRQIASMLGVTIRTEFFHGSEQFHPEMKLPILDEVVERLDLTFSDSSYKCAELLGDMVFTTSEIIKIVRYASPGLCVSYNTYDPVLIHRESNATLDRGLFALHEATSDGDKFIAGSRMLERSIPRQSKIELSGIGLVTKSLRPFVLQA